jgi:diacylglycerol kinase family enzyme
MRIAFIINPKSGRKRAHRLVPMIEATAKEQGWEVNVWLWDRVDALGPHVRSLVAQGWDRIVACGGDGTVHDVAQHLMGTNVALGILPLGTGNGIARHFGIPVNARRNLRAQAQMQPIRIDTGLVNGTPFVGFVGMGIDADVAASFANAQRRSFTTYVWLTFRAFLAVKRFPITLRVNGQEHHWQVVVLAAFNTCEYGHGAKIAAAANAQDGQLNFVGLGKPPLWKAPMIIYRIFTGTLAQTPYYWEVVAADASAQRSAPGALQIDGESRQGDALLEVQCVPANLLLTVPSTHQHR